MIKGNLPIKMPPTFLFTYSISIVQIMNLLLYDNIVKQGTNLLS